MYTDIQLEAIRLFWRKDLEFWLLFLSEKNKRILRYIWKDSWQYALSCEYSKWHILLFVESLNGAEILWHIPHLEDLLKRIKDWNSIYQVEPNSIWLSIWSDEREEEFWKEIPYNPTLPLLDQPSLPDIINIFK